MFGRKATVNREQVLGALREVQHPAAGRDIVSLEAVRDIEINGDQVIVRIVLNTPEPAVKNSIKAQAADALKALPGVGSAEVRMAVDLRASAPPPQPVADEPSDGPIPGVKYTLAVTSGKGGVGKSTVSVNLAVALRQLGFRVGLLDADVYGPSIPTMFGCEDGVQLHVNAEEQIVPLVKDELALFSIGFLVERDAAMIMRGPMLAKYVNDGLGRVAWGNIDFLVIDLPPGTGDVQLTLGQAIPVSGAIVVTTPQKVALADVRRAVTACDRLNIPVLGILENMSDPVGPDGARLPMFGHGGGATAAAEWEVPYLGEIPFNPAVPVSGDSGTPICESDGDGATAAAFRELAERVAIKLSGVDQGAARPTLTILD